MTDLRAIIFDLDGVLWKSETIHEQAYKTILATLGIKNFEYKSWAGFRTDEVFEQLLASQRVKPTVEEVVQLVAAKREFASQLFKTTNPQEIMAPHCLETLSQLSQRYTLALASSASFNTVKTFLNLSDTHAVFKAVTHGDEVSQGKPSPELFLTTAQRLGVSGRETLVVEDSVAGIKAAISAQMRVVGITGTNTKKELAALHPHLVIDQLSELLLFL